MSSRTLPSRPAPRSRSVGRTRDDDGPSTPARTPLPSGPRVTPSQTPRTPNRSQVSRGHMDGARTVSSTSSSSSSFLDRMKIRGGEPSSSRTSLEDDYEEQPKRAGGWASARNRRPVTGKEEQFDEDGYQDSDPVGQPAGHGYDLWGRVTAVASNLTVNVSKAWEKGIGAVDGEETPPGQESRLTKAMKAYHLDRARSPTDLPPWLFDEQERGVAPKSWNAPKRDEYEDQFMPEAAPRQRGGLRDIYDKAAASSPSTAPSSSRKGPEAGGSSTSGAANRLKAIREAKRAAMQTRADTDETPVGNRRHSPGHNDGRSPASVTEVRPSPARVGLPSGPGRARRV